MKDSIVNILEDFEKLAYKILMWVILIPKTIIKVTLDPGFVPDYVHGELNDKKGRQFDEYISPILLYLGITLVPAVAIYFIPSFGVTIANPQDDSSLYSYVIREDEKILAHNVELRANAVTKADTFIQYHVFKWEINGCRFVSPEEECETFYYGEVHDELNGFANVEFAGDVPAEADWFPDYSIGFADRNSVNDTFYFTFEPGDYSVTVSAANYSGTTPQRHIEDYYADMYINVPPDSEEIYYFSYNPDQEDGEDRRASLVEQFESGSTVALGLALLLPPLFLAMATSFFLGSKFMLSEDSLKETFYSQCYYFVPLGLAFWAWYYSDNFHTSDIPLPHDLLWIPLALALIWFGVVEVSAIAQQLPSKSKKRAFFILVGCLFVIFLLVGVGLMFSENYNLIRKSAIWFYPIGGVSLTIGILVVRYKKWRKTRNEPKNKE